MKPVGNRQTEEFLLQKMRRLQWWIISVTSEVRVVSVFTARRCKRSSLAYVLVAKQNPCNTTQLPTCAATSNCNRTRCRRCELHVHIGIFSEVWSSRTLNFIPFARVASRPLHVNEFATVASARELCDQHRLVCQWSVCPQNPLFRLQLTRSVARYFSRPINERRWEQRDCAGILYVFLSFVS